MAFAVNKAVDRMTISNWLFGTWGLHNLVGLTIVFFPASHIAVATDATVLFSISVVIPFVQAVLLSMKWHLNFSKRASSEYRRLIYRRWWRVFRRTPIASTAMILFIVAAFVSQLMHGPGHLRAANGKVGVSGPLIAFLFAFSAITVHTNLVVARKCQDIIHSTLWSKAENRARRKQKGHS